MSTRSFETLFRRALRRVPCHGILGRQGFESAGFKHLEARQILGGGPSLAVEQFLGRKCIRFGLDRKLIGARKLKNLVLHSEDQPLPEEVEELRHDVVQPAPKTGQVPNV